MLATIPRSRRRTWAAPLAAVIALGVFGLNEYAYQRLSDGLGDVIRRDSALEQIHTVVRRMVDAETGQRGYLISGRKEYLAPYEGAVRDVGQALDFLRVYYRDDGRAHGLLADVEKRSHEKLAELATTLRMYDEGRHDDWRAIIAAGVGRQAMIAIRRDGSELLAIESARLEKQRTLMATELQVSRIAVNVTTVVSLLALLLFLRQGMAFDAAQRQHAAALQTERDHLESEVARRTAELTELAGKLQSTREDERSRLARELHDELGALLTAAKLDAARLKRSIGSMAPEVEARLKHLNDTINHGIGLKRRIIEDLRPSSLSNLGLVAALQIQARDFAQRSEIKVKTELEAVPLADAGQITIFRLVQECLTNIAKYAGAREVRLVLDERDGRVHVSVSDDGKGFDVNARRGSASGLLGMRYRVEAAGGVMRVSSTPGSGTSVEAWLPAEPDARRT